MICLVLDEEKRSISLGSTLDPASAVNLEYLSIALQVRRKEGHEPIFSLDPVSAEQDLANEKHAMQQKVFVPTWLAGTSVGEVLFPRSDLYICFEYLSSAVVLSRHVC